jgi:hypothetical protein
MLGKIICLIAVLFCLIGYPVTTTLSGESASIRATAYVLPAVGFEENSGQLSAINDEPDWLIRCPSSGSLILHIETNNSISDYSYNRNTNDRILLPDIIQQNAADSCVITLIYSEN